MYIHGDFRDVNNVLYSVHILSDNDKTKELTIGEKGLFFSGSPISIETDIDDTFQTIIRRSATINLVTSDYIGDKLFANNSRNIKVNIYKEDLCIYAGFVEPNTFSQPFANGLEEFTINVTDALTTLQYYNYNDATLKNYLNVRQEAKVKTFKEMLDLMLGDILNIDIVNGTGGVVYYDLSKGITKGKESTIFNDCSMSELYLLGDEFDDVWTNEEVLEQMLQYLNLHIIQEGLDYYIFDWNSIKNKRTDWYNVTLQSAIKMNPLTIQMTSEMHSSSDTNLTVSDVYNQIQIKCSIEDQENIITSPLDKDNLTSLFDGKTKYMSEYWTWGKGDDKDKDKTATNWMHTMLQEKPVNFSRSERVDWYCQVMNPSNWKFKTLGGLTVEEMVYNDIFQYNKYIQQWKIPQYCYKNLLTPCILKLGSVKTIDAGKEVLNNKIEMNNYLYIPIKGNGKDIPDETSPTEADLLAHTNMIEYTGNQSGGVYSPLDDNTTNYLVFSGKVLLQNINSSFNYWELLEAYAQNNPYKYLNNKLKFGNEYKYYTRKFWKTYSKGAEPTELYGENSLQPISDQIPDSTKMFNYKYTVIHGESYNKIPVLECELIIGDKRLIEVDRSKKDGSRFIWVKIGEEPKLTVENNEQIPITTFSLSVEPKVDDSVIGQEHEMYNNISFDMNIDAKGTAIPITKEDALSGTITFRILGPHNLSYSKNEGQVYAHSLWYKRYTYNVDNSILAHLDSIIIKDFECKVYSDNAGNDNEDDNDLIYMSNETDKFINKKDDIEFKFITQLSSVECTQKGIKNSVNLNTVINTNTQTPLESIYNATTNETAKPEEHYIDQYYNEYSKPKLIMETDLHDTNDISIQNIFHSNVLKRNFFIQSINKDLKEASTHIKLKEV